MHKENILVAHGNQRVRNQICKYLTQLGYVTYQSSDGPSTLRVTRSIKPALVIIDVKITGMSPYRMGRIIEGDGLSSVLYMTKRPTDYFLKNIENFMIYAYILKPIQLEQLSRAVRFSIKMIRKMNGLKTEIAHLENQLKKREKINLAKALLMKELQINEPEAYKRIRQLSMNHSQRIIDTANGIIQQYS